MCIWTINMHIIDLTGSTVQKKQQPLSPYEMADKTQQFWENALRG